MENERQEYELEETVAKFKQVLVRDDLINYNDYLVEKRTRGSIFPRVMGLFIVVLSIIGIVSEATSEEPFIGSIILDAVLALCGVFIVIFLIPLTIKWQKKTIRKKLEVDFKPIIMNVIVNNEGIGFEAVEEKQEEIIEHVDVVDEEPKELTNEQAREQEYEENNEVEAEIVHDEVPTENVETNNPNMFTIPWGGIVRIDDNGSYMFLNMIGYQSLVIKKEACENIEKVVEYAKDQLHDPKRYNEMNQTK